MSPADLAAEAVGSMSSCEPWISLPTGHLHVGSARAGCLTQERRRSFHASLITTNLRVSFCRSAFQYGIDFRYDTPASLLRHLRHLSTLHYKWCGCLCAYTSYQQLQSCCGPGANIFAPRCCRYDFSSLASSTALQQDFLDYPLIHRDLHLLQCTKPESPSHLSIFLAF